MEFQYLHMVQFHAIFNNGDFEICIQSFLEAFKAEGTDSEMQEK